MKNILIISSGTQGTIPRLTFTLYQALVNCEGCRVFVAVMHDSGANPFPTDSSFVYSQKRFCSYLSKIRFLRKLKKAQKIDISISTIISCNVFNVLSKVNDKTIGVFHAPLIQAKYLGYLAYLRNKMCYRFIFPKLDRRYAVCKSVRLDVELHTGCPAQVVYNIHDFDKISVCAEEPLCTNEDVIFQRPTILYVGHLLDEKGVRRLISAFSKVTVNSNLVFVGGDEVHGTEPVSYKALVKAEGIEDKVFFLGFQENPFKYMKNCSTLVLPSYSEGLPGVLIEALYLNKKVITTNSSKGVWEIMQCYEDYRENLSKPFRTELGIIVSNSDTNNECIKQLADSICQILGESRPNILPFDKTRFDKITLTNYYTNLEL